MAHKNPGYHEDANPSDTSIYEIIEVHVGGECYAVLVVGNVKSTCRVSTCVNSPLSHGFCDTHSFLADHIDG